MFSNAKNHRMDGLVPLVVPLVNADHLDAIVEQRRRLGLRRGFIVTNANCSTTGLVVALKPLHDRYGIQQMNVVTMQAISGAGYPGVASMDILNNIVPLIDGEEVKLETEPCKILGQWLPSGADANGGDAGDAGDASGGGGCFVAAEMTIDATCNRVPVVDGHTECVSLRFERPPASVLEVQETLTAYVSEAQRLAAHSAPRQAIHVMKQADRPQPRLDGRVGGGFTVSVGRLREGNHWHVSFTLLSHNTILGAAGSSILNAELAVKMGYL